MVPIPRSGYGWHEEQIDELFSSLLGAGVGISSTGQSYGMPLVADGFRVFG